MNFTQILDFLYLGTSDAHVPQNVHCIISIGEELEYKPHDAVIHEFLDLEDSSSQDVTPYLDTVTEIIEARRLKQQHVYIHCRYGMSRSPLFVIAYLMRYLGYTYINAYTFIAQKREIGINPAFVTQLHRWCAAHGYVRSDKETCP